MEGSLSRRRDFEITAWVVAALPAAAASWRYVRNLWIDEPQFGKMDLHLWHQGDTFQQKQFWSAVPAQENSVLWSWLVLILNVSPGSVAAQFHACLVMLGPMVWQILGIPIGGVMSSAAVDVVLDVLEDSRVFCCGCVLCFNVCMLLGAVIFRIWSLRCSPHVVGVELRAMGQHVAVNIKNPTWVHNLRPQQKSTASPEQVFSKVVWHLLVVSWRHHARTETMELPKNLGLLVFCKICWNWSAWVSNLCSSGSCANASVRPRDSDCAHLVGGKGGWKNRSEGFDKEGSKQLFFVFVRFFAEREAWDTTQCVKEAQTKLE